MYPGLCTGYQFFCCEKLFLDNCIALSLLQGADLSGEASAKTRRDPAASVPRISREREKPLIIANTKGEMRMRKEDKNRNYKEVKLEGKGIDRYYKNPLTNVFQYEYALYRVVADLFSSVSCKSLCVESLRLYFTELPRRSEQMNGGQESMEKERKRKLQEDLLEEMTMLISRDVIGKINFPMMNICRAEVRVRKRSDETHSFIFTDGVYGFSVRLNMPGMKGHPKGIKVRNISYSPTEEKKSKGRAARKCAA